MSDAPIWSDVDEKAFLGCVVVSQGVLLDTFPCSEELFFASFHREFFRAIQSVLEKQKTVVMENIQSELGRETIEQVGLVYFTDLCFNPHPALAGQFYRTLCEKASIRKAQEMGRWIRDSALGVEDTAAFLAEINRKSTELEIQTPTENLLKTSVDAFCCRLDDISRGNKLSGHKTPWRAWNGVFGGLNDAHLYAVASRPGLGKTAMMEDMVCAMALQEKPVLVFEKDMDPVMLVERIACRNTGIPFWRFAKGMINPIQAGELKDCAQQLAQLPIHLYSPSGLTPEMMCAITRREVRKNGIKAVFLDHIQVLRVGKDLREGLTQASITIRTCVTETRIPHVILAHINRNGAKSRPAPEDIKEFDQLFGDCDGMGILWTDVEREKLQPGQKLPMKLYVAKNRSGPITEESLMFDGELMKFYDQAKE